MSFKKVCKVCGKEFAAQKTTIMFCSSACARKYRLRQKADERRLKVTAETVREKIVIRDLNSPDSEYIRMADAASFLGYNVVPSSRRIAGEFSITIYKLNQL